MMTCRLLCALLVLALCCCPSVCAAGSEDEKDRPEEDSDSTNFNPEVTNQVTQLLSTTSISSPEIHNEGRGTEDSQKMGILASYTTGTIEETPQSQNTSNITQDQDDGESNERTEHTNTVTANGQKKAAAPTTTTSTTQAPTTSNTQAPTTTTTTRTPSRLREIDGGLSSSAWVCAPLLLAVSALAYTAVG
ncbi:putative mucin TcMUCII [Trypanosoma cruzi]|nr:putative mucin TcMUCII [Trypanosoma cruzi]